jgi:hypothetical protein
MLKSVLSSIASIILLFSALPAWSGPPFVTDDPGVLEYQHHELFIAASQTNTADGRTVTPSLDYSFGALPDLQIGISVPYAFDRPDGLPQQQGLGDVVLGAKYCLLQETDDRAMMTFAPLVTIPSGDADKGLGNGASQFFLPVWIQKQWGNWLSYGGAGYWINNAQGAGNHWYYGAALQYDISAQVTIGAEIFHETDQLPADTASSGFNLGGIYNLDEQHRLLFSVGRGLRDASTQNRFSSYFAYAFTW